MTLRIVPLAVAILIGAGTPAVSAPNGGPLASHGVEAVPLVDDLEIAPLVPPMPAKPQLDPLEAVPLVAPKPPPVIEIIRWKKKPVKRPRQPNVSRSGGLFNGYIAGTQSATIQWAIAGVDPGPCIRQNQATAVAFASTRPVLVSATPRSSFSIIPMPVTINFASSIAYSPDIENCFRSLQPSTSCRLDGRGIPGTATIQTRGTSRVTRSVYLQSLTIDEAKAGSSCVGGLYGFPDIVKGDDSAVYDAKIPWGAISSRSGQNVNISQSYALSGNQATQPPGSCTYEGEGWTCSVASQTKWTLRLVRARPLR